MGDPNMDFENMANLVEEDPSPILSSGVREVFHLFANMLDIKSFMNLALANKEMYNRCMEEDKRIRINLEEKQVSLSDRGSYQSFSFYSFDVCGKNIAKYLEKLRQLKCNVYLKMFHFQGFQTSATGVMKARHYLEEVGVKTIDTIQIDGVFTGQEHISFIKDYQVKNVSIERGLPDDLLRSLLQMNLSTFSYNGPVEGQLLLEVDSSIPHMKLTSMQSSAGVFTEILAKIQSGVLKKLIVDTERIPWREFPSITSKHDGPLPNERPLLITQGDTMWFLHWNEAMTKCDTKLGKVEIFKCDLEDSPVAVNSEERVHKALTEKRPISCFKHHFVSFFDKYTVLDASHEGAFPKKRPLLCKLPEEDEIISYFLINEDDSIDEYSWENWIQKATHKGYDMEKVFLDESSDHTALMRFVMDKRIEKRVDSGEFECMKVEEFRSLFKHYETIPLSSKEHLPSHRPLVFSQRKKYGDTEYRIVLYEDDHLVQYTYEDFDDCAKIQPCSAWNRPPSMISMENLKEILINAPFEKFTYKIGYNMFREAFEGLPTLRYHAFGRLPKEYPITFVT